MMDDIPCFSTRSLGRLRHSLCMSLVIQPLQSSPQGLDNGAGLTSPFPSTSILSIPKSRPQTTPTPPGPSLLHPRGMFRTQTQDFIPKLGTFPTPP